MRRELDVVIISDAHLGTYGSHARELLSYLKSINPKCLIINGDFIDGWQFKKKYFPRAHMGVIYEILNMAMNGSRVYYLTGNHDDMLRRFSDLTIGKISIRDKLVLHLNGQRYWIFHGDVFDISVLVSPTLAVLGGKGYDLLIRINRIVNHMRKKMGLPRKSFAHRVKRRFKKAVQFIQDFERHAIELGARQGYDYVVCGHIHIPAMRTENTEFGQIKYMNAGDWVENLTSLEYNFGEWTLYQYNELDFEMENPKLEVKKKTSKKEKISSRNWNTEDFKLEL